MQEKINILFSSYPDFSGNPKSLYEYIKNNYPNKFNLFWVIYSDEFKEILSNLNINFVFFKSQEYEKLICNIDLIFDTNGFLLSEKKENQIYVNLWHGSSPKKKGYLLPKENFAEQDYEYYKLAQRKTDFLIVPSEFSKLIFSSVFNINAQKVLPLGYPRDEYLINSNGLANLQKFTDLDLKKFNKIIFYLPTFRSGCNRSDSNNIFENNLLNIEHYDEEDLKHFLEENNFLLVVKKHPAELNNFNDINSSNIIILSEDSMNQQTITIYELLNAADLLIADYSSVYVEYLSLERPVLFFHQDIDSYTKNRGLILQESNLWFPGPKVLNFKDFTYNILELLNNPNFYRKERSEFRNLMFNKNISHISKDIFEYLFDTTTLSLKYKPSLALEEQLENEVSNLNNEISKLKSEMTIKASKHQEELNNLMQEKDKIIEDNNILRNELSTIYHSRSWKFFRIFQRIKKGGKS